VTCHQFLFNSRYTDILITCEAWIRVEPVTFADLLWICCGEILDDALYLALDHLLTAIRAVRSGVDVNMNQIILINATLELTEMLKFFFLRRELNFNRRPWRYRHVLLMECTFIPSLQKSKLAQSWIVWLGALSAECEMI